MKAYVAYYRVSTLRQGQSGLGLDAQRAAVCGFTAQGSIVQEFTEVESGKKNNRPQLAAAIAAAKAARATLVIAKLDRLARNVAFTSWLLESGIDFVCVDNPTANRLTIHIIAAIAENEATMISQRTRAALAAKKARGFKLGSPVPIRLETIALGRATQQQNARTAKANVQASGIIADKLGLGWTLQAIANYLNQQDFRTRRGCLFTPCTVQRLATPASLAMLRR